MTTYDTRTTRRLRRLAGRGSAYLLTLLALVILTIIGLSVTLTTQTERQLSANERVVQETFYAADSGMELATARAMWLNNQSKFTYTQNQRARLDPGNPGGQIIVSNRVNVSPVQQLRPMPCNLCSQNQGDQLFNVSHAITAFAERVDQQGGQPERAIGRRRVGKMIEIQPWGAKVEPDIFDELDEDYKVRY